MTATEKPALKDVYAAINYVMGKVGYVQKERGRDLPYSFASEAAFIKAVRPYLVEAGLVVYQCGVEILNRSEFTSKKGATGINILARFHWKWVHAPSGTSIDVSSIGEAADYGDKAANKAMTAAMKYNMRQTLVIETGDDPDETASDEYERDSKASRTIERPLSPETLRSFMAKKAAKHEGDKSTPAQFGLAMGTLNLCFAGDANSDDKRHSVLAYLFGKDTGKDLADGEVLALLDWLKPTREREGEPYLPDGMAAREAQAVVAARMKEQGQEELMPETDDAAH